MPRFVVAHATNDHDFDEDALTLNKEVLKLKGQRAQRGIWLVESDVSARELFQALEQHVSEQDHLMVLEFTGRPAWRLALRGTSAWLNHRI